MSKTYMAEADCTNEFQPIAGFSEIKKDQQLVTDTGKGAQASNIFASILFGLKVSVVVAKKIFFWPLYLEPRHHSTHSLEVVTWMFLFIWGPVGFYELYSDISTTETLSSFLFSIALMGLSLWVPVQYVIEVAARFVDVCKEKLSDIAEEVRTQK